MRLQLALNVDDIDQAVDFYSKLFDAKPAKRKPGYANFAIENPPLKLVLFEVKDVSERLHGCAAGAGRWAQRVRAVARARTFRND